MYVCLYVLYAFLYHSSNPDQIWHRQSIGPWEKDRLYMKRPSLIRHLEIHFFVYFSYPLATEFLYVPYIVHCTVCTRVSKLY